jgi:hypothetical protein
VVKLVTVEHATQTSSVLRSRNREKTRHIRRFQTCSAYPPPHAHKRRVKMGGAVGANRAETLRRVPHLVCSSSFHTVSVPSRIPFHFPVAHAKYNSHLVRLRSMKQAFGGVVYDTDTSILVARNEHQFCIETLKTGLTNVDLFRTPSGRYFKCEKKVPFFGEDEAHDPELTPLTLEEAVAVYDKLTDRRLEFEDAFPNFKDSNAELTP